MNSHKNAVGPGDCDHDLIDQFLESDQYPIDALPLIRHLDHCEACRNYMQSRAGSQEAWEKSASLLKPTEYDHAGTSHFSAASSVLDSNRQPLAAAHVLEQLPPSEFPNHLGRLGTYEITGVVGVGGMGVVLKAIDPSLDRVVAIKVMNPRLANNDNARRRFAREAKAAAAVLHPNVIPIHSVSTDCASPYLVMAYVRGGSLQKRLQKDGPLPLIEVLRIGSQIAAGLAAAHDQGLVHRDIKPENILLEEGVERVTITDFGLARAVDDNTVTQQGTIAGTPMYMSPEQARGEQLDQSSDLFSLGSVLYALCTGRPPYVADSSYGVMRQIIDEDPRPLREINRDIPEWFAKIVCKLMARNKTDRFTSATEVRQTLEACLSHVQHPTSYALPVIPNGNSQPLKRRTKGSSRMIKFAAGMLTMAIFVIVANQFLWLPKSTPEVGTNHAVEIRNSVQFDIPEITVELAERLIGRTEHMSFTKVTTLSPEVATVLAKHPANLSFPAITQLSAEVAHALVSQKENLWISMTGLKDVTPELARSFATAKCALDLSGVGQLTPETAEILGKKTGTLKLGLKSITPEIAARLAHHEHWLSLDSLREIDAGSATELAKHRGWLTLGGLVTITPEVAGALGQFHGDKLEIGLTLLDLETATQLANAQCKGGLYLDKLESVSAEMVDVLASRNDVLSFQGLRVGDSSTEQSLRNVVDGLRAKGTLVLLPQRESETASRSSLPSSSIIEDQIRGGLETPR